MHEHVVVTVVTPSHNYGRFIEDCLRSVHQQTYPHIEHLVLDACSSDDTAKVLRAFSRADLTVISERDAGQADALNKGFDRARGDVLCWLNADDYWLTDTVVEEALAAIDGADVVTGGGCRVDPHGRRLATIRAPAGKTLARDLQWYDPILQPATFWRRSAHQRLRADMHYAFDWAMFLAMHRQSARFKAVQREWAAYRWHPEGKTASASARRKEEVATILRETCGEKSLQYRWAKLIATGVARAEQLDSVALKRLLSVADLLVASATRHRIRAL
jgi:glycosyltransferase involved in cell wall biosynthesis